MTNTDFRKDNGPMTFVVRVIPRASRSEIGGEFEGALKVRLKSAPVDGAANKELVRLLAKEFGVSRSDVEIVSGETSRIKRVRINSGNAARVLTVLMAKT